MKQIGGCFQNQTETPRKKKLVVSVLNRVSIRSTDWKKFLLTCPNVELLVSYSHKQEICYDLTVQANYSLSTHASICVKGDTIK
jgi:hypothetical protein